MAGEIVVELGTQKTLEASGGAIANGSVVQANDATYSVSSDGGGYPDAIFVLTGAFGTAPTEGATLVLMARPLDIDGTADAEVPEATRPTCVIGAFEVNNVTTSQSMLLRGGYAADVPMLAEYYVYNNGTGQQLSAGWALKATPRTVKTAT